MFVNFVRARDMVKRVPSSKQFAAQSKKSMPFADGGERKPTTWKQKQRACVFAGLRALKAPAAGGVEILVGTCFVSPCLA